MVHLCNVEVRSAFTRRCSASLSTLTWLVYELLSCRFGRFRLHTSLRLRALIRSWRGVYVCKFRSTRTRFQFKKTLPVEHSSEHFCCVGTHFQAFMNLSDVFSLRCFSEARKKHFRRNFRKCSRMRANLTYIHSITAMVNNISVTALCWPWWWSGHAVKREFTKNHKVKPFWINWLKLGVHKWKVVTRDGHSIKLS